MAAVGRTIRASASSSQVEATVFVYDFGGGKANHFLLLTPAGRGQGAFASMVQSVTRITSQEAADIKPRRISVVIVKAGDTVQSIADVGLYRHQLERFWRSTLLRSKAS